MRTWKTALFFLQTFPKPSKKQNLRVEALGSKKSFDENKTKFVGFLLIFIFFLFKIHGLIFMSLRPNDF